MSIFGNRGKLSSRLKKIKNNFSNNKSKNKLKSELKDKENKQFSKSYYNFLNVIGSVSTLVCSTIDTKDNDSSKKNSINLKKTGVLENKKLKLLSKEKVIKTGMISKIDVSLMMKQKNNLAINDENLGINSDKETNINYGKNKETFVDDVKPEKEISNDILNEDEFVYNIKNKGLAVSEETVLQLEKKIINRIKKILIKMVNEYEILDSELFIISTFFDDNKTYNECKQTIDEIKKMICKIDKLKNKYNFLKDNYDFEYMLEIDDNFLADDILKLKEMISSDEVKSVVTDYKLLDLYKFLYLRIDKLDNETIEYEKYKEEKLLELKERDIDFEKLYNKVYKFDEVKKSYDFFVNNEEKYLNELSDKVSKIDSHEEINVKMIGFNDLLLSSFKYLGLLMLNPFKGIFPSIFIQTLIARNIVKNLYKNLHFGEHRKMVYSAIDFSSEIDGVINNLNFATNMVDKTLNELALLKDEYNKKFKSYQNEFVQYRDVIDKINDMENKILGNKIKIEIMKNKSLENKKSNSKKLTLLKKLNNI